MATIDFQALVNGEVCLAMEVVECAHCGTPFAMTKRLNTRHRQNHEGFFCPSGHSNYYPQQTDEEQLRDELAQVRAKLAAAKREAAWARRDAQDAATEYQAEKRQHAATKGQLTKTLRRVEAGVCPHCRRHFVNLERHCQTKHPTEVRGERS